MTLERYLAPTTLAEAARAAGDLHAALLAGGTDLLPRCSKGLVQSPRTIVDLKRVAELQGISRVDGEIHVGACTPMSDIEANPIICQGATVLAEAAGRIACPQIRNRATIGGNLCNASPAADSAIALLILDATLDLTCVSDLGLQVREVPITDFFLGPGTTVAAPGEILTRIRFQPLGQHTFAAWDKFGTRPAMEIAVAAVCATLEFSNNRVTRARIAYGSVAPVPLRGLRAEEQLLNKPLSQEVMDLCEAAARTEIRPITDVRASAEYRREVVGIMMRRLLRRARRHCTG